MLAWEDFDKRITKIMCDKCHSDITAQLNNALGDKTVAGEGKMVLFNGMKPNPESMVKQTVFNNQGNKFVLMQFRGGPINPKLTRWELLKTIFKVYKEIS